jgi:glutaredoxin
MKSAKLTAPVDYFAVCPYCERNIETNIVGPIKCGHCKKVVNIVFDPSHFADNASYNIYERKELSQ